MAHLAVIQAVEARLAAGFDRCPVYIENSGAGTPSDGSPFLVLQFPWSSTSWATIEGPDGCDFLEEGAFRFVLAIEAGAGAHQGRQWLAEIADLFRAESFAGVQTFAPDTPVADDRNDLGNYYRLSMAVPYQFMTNG